MTDKYDDIDDVYDTTYEVTDSVDEHKGDDADHDKKGSDPNSVDSNTDKDDDY